MPTSTKYLTVHVVCVTGLADKGIALLSTLLGQIYVYNYLGGLFNVHTNPQ